MSPAVTEDFMKTLRSLGAAVVPTLQRAAPSIIRRECLDHIKII
jgi:hypothetical protein